MLNLYKDLIANQYEAVFCMLDTCIDRCPDGSWDAPVANHPFCESVFHALFYADLYLGRNLESLREQPFHRDNAQIFRDYEELEDRKPVLLYDKKSVKAYLEHCRTKASEVVAAETTQTLSEQSGSNWLQFSRAEEHVYNIRHLQHHAAQLSMRLRIDADVDIPWAKSGWRDR